MNSWIKAILVVVFIFVVAGIGIVWFPGIFAAALFTLIGVGSFFICVVGVHSAFFE